MSDSDDEQSAEEFAREMLRQREWNEAIEEATGGMGAGSQVNFYYSDVSWTRVERLAGVISVLISVFWVVSQPIETWAGIQIPFAVIASSAFGISALGDYLLHLKYGSRPKPPDLHM